MLAIFVAVALVFLLYVGAPLAILGLLVSVLFFAFVTYKSLSQKRVTGERRLPIYLFSILLLVMFVLLALVLYRLFRKS